MKTRTRTRNRKGRFTRPGPNRIAARDAADSEHRKIRKLEKQVATKFAKLFPKDLVRLYQQKANAIANDCTTDDELWHLLDSYAHEMMFESKRRERTFTAHWIIVRALRLMLFLSATEPKKNAV
jgi:hypothetical protein